MTRENQQLHAHVLESLESTGGSILTTRVAKPESLGFERGDVGLSEIEAAQKILEEGRKLSGITEIVLGDGRKIAVTTTTAASPHTCFTVPYADFERVYKSCIEEESPKGITSATDSPLIVRKEKGEMDGENHPDWVPLDMITWAFLLNKDGTIAGPIDLNDIVSKKEDYDDNPILRDSLAPFLLGLADDPDRYKQFCEAVTQRMGFSTTVVHRLYNEIFRNDAPWLTYGFSIPRSEILQYFVAGYHRGSESKGLGHRSYDGLGDGPQSNPTFHVRVNMPLPGKAIMDLVSGYRQYDPEVNTDTVLSALNGLEAYKDRVDKTTLLESVFMADNARKRKVKPDLLGSDPEMAELLIKQTNPYSHLAQIYLGGFLESVAKKVYGKEGTLIEQFADYDDESPTIYGARGVEVLIVNGNPSETLAKTGLMYRELSKFWRDCTNAAEYYHWGYLLDGVGEEGRYIKLDEVKRKYEGLPDDFKELVINMWPTQKQLALWKEKAGRRSGINFQGSAQAVEKLEKWESRYEKVKERFEREADRLSEKITGGEAELSDLAQLVSLRLRMQVFDEHNLGYNITGVPGVGITYVDDYGVTSDKLRIQWLLSKTGVAELYTGTMLRRTQKI